MLIKVIQGATNLKWNQKGLLGVPDWDESRPSRLRRDDHGPVINSFLISTLVALWKRINWYWFLKEDRIQSPFKYLQFQQHNLRIETDSKCGLDQDFESFRWACLAHSV